MGAKSEIEDLLVRESGPWPRIVFTAGGFEYEFDCAELRLVVEATEMPDDMGEIEH